MKLWNGRTMTGMVLLLMVALFAAAMPASAASPQLTPTQKASFDGMVSKADAGFADKLTRGYREFEAAGLENRDWETRTAALHYRNGEDLVVLRKRIREIDADKLAKLKRQSDETKARYQKLFDGYRAVNQQLEVARKLNNKTLTAVLRSQADAMKIPVQLARQDIRNHDTALQTARAAASAKMKKIRNTLTAVDPLQVQIRAAKSALSAPKDSRSAVWKSFTQAVGKRDAKSAADLLGSVNDLSRQLIERQQKIHALETRIADIVRQAGVQLSQP